MTSASFRSFCLYIDSAFSLSRAIRKSQCFLCVSRTLSVEAINRDCCTLTRALVFSEENRIRFWVTSLYNIASWCDSPPPLTKKQHKGARKREDHSTHTKKTQSIFYSIARASSVFTNSARSRVFCLLLSRFLTRPTYTRAQTSQRDCVLQRTTFCPLSFVHLQHKSDLFEKKRRKQR